MEDEIRKATPIPPSSPSPPQTESEPAATPTPPAPPAPAASAPAATPAPKPAENKLPALAPPAESDAAPAVSAAAAVPTVALESGKGRGSGVLKGKDGKFVRRGGNLATRSSHKEVSQVSGESCLGVLVVRVSVMVDGVEGWGSVIVECGDFCWVDGMFGVD